MGDRYDEMTGPALSEELARRELPVSGRVEELRARLREDDEKRAQSNADGSDETDAAPDTEYGDSDDVAVPEPRQPRREQLYGVALTEEQARVLNAASASLRRHFRYVTPVSERKYCAGDQVMVIGSPEDTKVLVLPFGVEIELSDDTAGDQEDED